MTCVAVVVDRLSGHHEVSLVIAARTGAGRCFGSQPDAKVSMMIMRPPQQGQGRGRMLGSSAAAASAM
jgi:hypothetical protein